MKCGGRKKRPRKAEETRTARDAWRLTKMAISSCVFLYVASTAVLGRGVGVNKYGRMREKRRRELALDVWQRLQG
jgi:hypothetical protein